MVINYRVGRVLLYRFGHGSLGKSLDIVRILLEVLVFGCYCRAETLFRMGWLVTNMEEVVLACNGFFIDVRGYLRGVYRLEERDDMVAFVREVDFLVDELYEFCMLYGMSNWLGGGLEERMEKVKFEWIRLKEVF